MRSAIVFALLAAATLGAASSTYRVLGTVPVGGDGWWDYLTVDAAARRAYVSHGTHVAVVDLESGKVVGDIPDTQGVHGIALAPKLNRGYTSNGRANNVTVFDLRTLKPLEQISTGKNPDAILYHPGTNRVFTFNGQSKDSTAIDAATGKVLATIPLGGKPEFPADDGKGRIFVNVEDTHEIAEIDASGLAVTRRYSLTGCEEPSGLAMDTAKRRLFSACGNKVMAISDPDSGKVVMTLPIGEGADGAGFDAGKGLAFSSNGEGTLTVVRQSSGQYEVAGTVKTKPGARTMAIDTKTHKIYLPTAEFGPAPPATPQQPHPRPPSIPGSFMLIVVGE